ncbi:MAG: hypothetical protein MUE52_05890 [Tabrizicola sp.]|nr:hypothetical protein [Tabrizicola sp.]
MPPKFELDQKKTELLLRAALLDDAANIGERLGALLADINVDEEGDAWITLDEDLWPGEKDPEQAMSVAKLLGIELEVDATAMTFPFHWPGLAEHTSSTAEYVSILLDAYGGRTVDLRRQ